MTSSTTTHPIPACVGLNSKGEPCTRAARPGTDTCGATHRRFQSTPAASPAGQSSGDVGAPTERLTLFGEVTHGWVGQIRSRDKTTDDDGAPRQPNRDEVVTIGNPNGKQVFDPWMKIQGFLEDSGVDIDDLTDTEMDYVIRCAELVGKARSAGTTETQSRGWDDFAAFCDEHGFSAFPATPLTVKLYLSYLTLRGSKVKGKEGQALTHAYLAARLSMIGTAHTMNGFANPTKDPIVREVLKGYGNENPRPIHQAAPLLAQSLKMILAHLSAPDQYRLRDKALFLLSFCPEQVSLQQLATLKTWAQVDLPNTDDSPLVLRTKDRMWFIDRNPDPVLCPVEAILALRAQAEFNHGNDPDAEHAVLLAPPFPNYKSGTPLTVSGMSRQFAVRIDEAALTGSYGTLNTKERHRLAVMLSERSPIVVRDHALFDGMWWMAARSIQGADLRWGHIDRQHPDKWKVTLRPKALRNDGPPVVWLHRHEDDLICPIRALEEWHDVYLDLLRQQPGNEHLTEIPPDHPVYPRLDNHAPDNWAERAMTPHAIAERITTIAEAAGIPIRITSHSLRAGLITSAHLAGNSLVDIADHANHANITTTRRYIRVSTGLRGLHIPSSRIA